MNRRDDLSRLVPLDVLRGAIMVVMALDHANAFIAHQHPAPEFWRGPYPAYPDTLSFLTRLVTHLAAPGFFFLMGAGMMLFADTRRRQGWRERSIMLHFIVRGMILILLQVFVENQAWIIGSAARDAFNPIYFGVLYALGGSLIFGTLLLRLSTRGLIGVAVVILIGAELVLTTVAPNATLNPLWYLSLVPTPFAANIVVYYPIVPWLGVTALGMAFGRWLIRDRAQVYRVAWRIGVAALLAFICLRALDGFGNLRATPGSDWIAFLNVVKYPPSLTFLLLTLGVNLCLLSVFARIVTSFARALSPLVILGRSPLFFYIAHLFLYAWIGLAFGTRSISIAQMYPYWLLGLLILLPLCWLFSRFKHNRPPQSLWRLI